MGELLGCHNGRVGTGAVSAADSIITAYYRQRRDYGEADDVPLVIGGQEAARIPVRELLP